MKKLFILFIAVAGFVATSKAQISKTANASATIVTPIGLTKTIDMNFGNVAVSASGGTVILPSTGGSRTTSGGVTLPATAGTVTMASFTVTGTGGYSYAITLPSAALTVTDPISLSTMTVETFESTPSATGVLNGAGSQILNVGATLNVAANQTAGVYTSATPFTVTVNYN
ncbi:MAG: DUF4402 domain-containing protein [Prolixibacteraceae bacterium]